MVFLQSEDEKKEAEWYDVGVIKGTSFTVQHYYLPGDEPLDITQSLTMDVFKGRAKIALEPGTAYKFRVAAVNSCGRSAWSEVANSILYSILFNKKIFLKDEIIYFLS